jgi:hypothetical protein
MVVRRRERATAVTGVRLSVVQRLSDLGFQSVHSKQLLDRLNAGVQHPAVGNDAFRVAGHVEDLHRRVVLGNADNEFLSVHLGHDNVGEQQLPRPSVIGKNRKRLSAVCCSQNRVALLLKDPLCKATDRGGVLGQQDGLGCHGGPRE